MGERGWVKAFTARGRTGAYLSVTQAGTILPGDEIQVAWRPGHGITVPMAFRAWMGDREIAQALLDTRALGPAGHAEPRGRLARRTR